MSFDTKSLVEIQAEFEKLAKESSEIDLNEIEKEVSAIHEKILDATKIKLDEVLKESLRTNFQNLDNENKILKEMMETLIKRHKSLQNSILIGGSILLVAVISMAVFLITSFNRVNLP